MRKKILTAISALITLIAATSASTASWFLTIYQPKVPKCLDK